MRLALLCLFFVGFCVELSGCAGHQYDYLHEGNQVSPLVVPPGVPGIKQEPYYPIPNTVTTASKGPVSLKPATMADETMK